MDKNVLFINKRHEIVEGFLRAMAPFGFSIDTAEDGVIGMERLKDKEYQVVISGLRVDGYDGEEILYDLKKKHPDTVLIVYTTVLHPADLLFLVNTCDVFRIFLRPADYQGSFLKAIQEGIEYYWLKKEEHREESQKNRRRENFEESVDEVKKALLRQEKGEQYFDEFARRLLRYSAMSFAENLNEQEKNKLVAYEENLMEKYKQHQKKRMHDVSELRSVLREECEAEFAGHRIEIQLPEVEQEGGEAHLENIADVIFLMLHYYQHMGIQYEADIRLAFQEGEEDQLDINLLLPGEKWKQKKESELENAYLQVVEHSIQSMARERIESSVTKNGVEHRISIRH